MQRTGSAAENPATAIQSGEEMPPPALLRQPSRPASRGSSATPIPSPPHLHGDDRRWELPRPESSCPASGTGQRPRIPSAQLLREGRSPTDPRVPDNGAHSTEGNRATAPGRSTPPMETVCWSDTRKVRKRIADHGFAGLLSVDLEGRDSINAIGAIRTDVATRFGWRRKLRASPSPCRTRGVCR